MWLLFIRSKDLTCGDKSRTCSDTNLVRHENEGPVVEGKSGVEVAQNVQSGGGAVDRYSAVGRPLQTEKAKRGGFLARGGRPLGSGRSTVDGNKRNSAAEKGSFLAPSRG